MTLDPGYFAGAIEGLICLGVLLAILYGPWQRMCTSYARDVIFEQRDAIFDIAASGRLAFGSEPYETIRSSLNALIRLAHRLTLFDVLLFAFVSRRSELHPPRGGVRAALAQIADANTREEVTRHVYKSELAVVVMILMRAPGLVMTLALFGAYAAARQGFATARASIRRSLTTQIEGAMSIEARGRAG